MSSMNNFNNSMPDALSPSKAIMGSGHDMGMHHRDGEEEHGDPIYLQKNSTAIQEEEKEENEGKKEEKIKEKGESNEEEKGINEEKKKKKGKRSCGTRDIFMSASGSVNKLDEHIRTNQQLHDTSNMHKHVLNNKLQKNNSSLLRDICHSPENSGQNSLGYDSKEQQFISFPSKLRWNDMSKSGDVGLWELCENKSLDPLNQIETQYSDQYTLNQCENKANQAILPELHKLPDYLCEQLDKNNRFGVHQVTNKDSLGSIDAEYTEFLNETFGITGIQPVFIDHSGFVIWLLDKVGNMYQWNEMQRSLRYMGKDLIDGLTNHFIYPEKLCEVMEDTGELIPIEEFKRKMEEKAKRMWDNRIILKNIIN
ncbi:hypothetical protein RhiirA4_528630 [Rhizophagus irregularis]|uniref:Uncharacterized protein n=1 Tax=Rhizophagus irregularis TaxID=588596 RepID=A0A2I1GT45_9GLOM|nr:hypothetical protein RhiirA4_528630 [Rhizophagus irregularis]